MKSKIEYFVKPEPYRKESFWYDGQVAEITGNGKTISIEATGLIRASFGDKDMTPTKARKLRFTDRRLSWLNFENNNWFTLYEKKGNEYEWIPDTVAYSYTEAISLAKTLLS